MKINGIKPQGKPWTLFSGASPGELNHNFSSAEFATGGEGGLMKEKYRHSYLCARFLIVLLFTFSISCYSQVRVGRNLSLQSKVLDKKIHYSVVLPESYYTGSQHYPVIYLLHGFGGNHESWLNRCLMAELVDSLLKTGDIGEFIYVLPDAGNSYYINNYDNSFSYNDFFIHEFIPTIDSIFRTIPRKEARILMGLSMGGFGSIILAIKHPELFGSVVALSPAVRNRDIYANLAQKNYETYFGAVYGTGLENDNRITEHWKENSPYYIINSVTSVNYSAINWYIDCGLNDSLLPASEAFHHLLLQNGIPHEYHVRPGEHNWSFWYHSTIHGLIYITRKLAANQ